MDANKELEFVYFRQLVRQSFVDRRRVSVCMVGPFVVPTSGPRMDREWTAWRREGESAFVAPKGYQNLAQGGGFTPCTQKITCPRLALVAA
jgi:hypothetical protein